MGASRGLPRSAIIVRAIRAIRGPISGPCVLSLFPLLRHDHPAIDQCQHNRRRGKPGLDVLPAPKPPDRYYDDNAWMALAEVFELTRDPRDLQFADEALKFVLSGEDLRLGGGICWHEDRNNSKHTCTCAPAAAAALEMHKIAKDRSYLQTGQRLYNSTKLHLLDLDGLYADSISVADGAWITPSMRTTAA